MSDKDDIPVGCGVVLFAAVVIALLSIWVVSSSFEARAFNRNTGAHATTWDAMWTELRVMRNAN